MKIFCLCIGLLLCAVPSFAFPIAFENTYAELFDFPNVYMYAPIFGRVGGPAADNSMGYAQRFTLTETTYISSVDFDMHLTTFNHHRPGFIDFDFFIYEGDKVWHDDLWNFGPDRSQLHFRSSPVVLHTDLDFYTQGGVAIYKEEQDILGLTKAIDITLNPGSYWLAHEREYGQSMDYGAFKSKTLNGSTAVPEPASLLLMMGGLGWMVRRRS